jgi:hypothetical protein
MHTQDNQLLQAAGGRCGAKPKAMNHVNGNTTRTTKARLAPRSHLTSPLLCGAAKFKTKCHLPLFSTPPPPHRTFNLSYLLLLHTTQRPRKDSGQTARQQPGTRTTRQMWRLRRGRRRRAGRNRWDVEFRARQGAHPSAPAISQPHSLSAPNPPAPTCSHHLFTHLVPSWHLLLSARYALPSLYLSSSSLPSACALQSGHATETRSHRAIHT